MSPVWVSFSKTYDKLPHSIIYPFFTAFSFLFEKKKTPPRPATPYLYGILDAKDALSGSGSDVSGGISVLVTATDVEVLRPILVFCLFVGTLIGIMALFVAVVTLHRAQVLVGLLVRFLDSSGIDPCCRSVVRLTSGATTAQAGIFFIRPTCSLARLPCLPTITTTMTSLISGSGVRGLLSFEVLVWLFASQGPIASCASGIDFLHEGSRLSGGLGLDINALLNGLFSTV